MPAVAKKAAKLAKPKAVVAQPKKQTLKKKQKTAEINAAKKLAKLKSSKAISDKVSDGEIKHILLIFEAKKMLHRVKTNNKIFV